MCSRTFGAAGIGAMTGSLVVALAFAILCYVAFRFVIPAEEGYLEKIFGETYPAYQARGAAFLSRSSRSISESEC